MLTKIIDEALVQKAKHLLAHAKKVAVISHMGPDGDALGSCLAMADFLKAHNLEVRVILPDAFPDFLNWLPGADKILLFSSQEELCTQYLKETDLIIFLDFNQLARIRQLGELIKTLTVKTILFDHHPGPDQMADVVISYPQLASTSEIVFRYICRTGYFDQMTKQCAECVYTGMMTDTGAFTFNSNDEEMYYIISQLIRKGINKDDIYSRVYNTYSADRMKLMGFLLYERMQLWLENRTAVITLSLDDLKLFQYKVGDTEGFVNLPLSIEAIDFSVFIREDTDKIKLSFRSKGNFPANRVAAELFNGGGHLNAAGGEFYGTLEEAVSRLKSSLTTLEPTR